MHRWPVKLHSGAHFPVTECSPHYFDQQSEYFPQEAPRKEKEPQNEAFTFLFSPFSSWSASISNSFHPKYHFQPPDPVFCVLVRLLQAAPRCLLCSKKPRWLCRRPPGSRCTGHGGHAGVTAQTAVPPEVGSLPGNDGWVGQVSAPHNL